MHLGETLCRASVRTDDLVPEIGARLTEVPLQQARSPMGQLLVELEWCWAGLSGGSLNPTDDEPKELTPTSPMAPPRTAAETDPSSLGGKTGEKGIRRSEGKKKVDGKKAGATDAAALSMRPTGSARPGSPGTPGGNQASFGQGSRSSLPADIGRKKSSALVGEIVIEDSST